jgi:lipopolysaccharide assembly outer membrane protein LptD (OstA)
MQTPAFKLLLVLSLLTIFAVVVFGQGARPPAPPAPPPPSNRPIPKPYKERPFTVTAGSIEREGSVIRYRRDVQMDTESIMIRADELDFNEETREVQLRGNVRAKMKGFVAGVIPLTK